MAQEVELPGGSGEAMLGAALSDETLWTGRTSAPLDLLEGPGLDHGKVVTLPEGARVRVLGEEGDWLAVRAGARRGWISAQLVEAESPRPEVGAAELAAELTAARIELEELRGAVATAIELRADLATSEAARAELETTVSALGADLERALTGPASESSSAAELASLQERHALLETANAELIQALDSVRGELEAAEEMPELRVRLAASEAAQSDLEQAVSDLTTELEAARQLAAVAGEDDRRVAELEERHAAAEAERARLEAELTTVRAAVEASVADRVAGLAESEAAQHELEAVLADLRSQLQAAHEQSAEAADGVAELNALRRRVTELESVVVESDAALEGARQQLAERPDPPATDSALSASEAARAELEMELEKVRARVTELARSRAEFSGIAVSQLEAERDRLRRDLAASEQARRGIWARLEVLRRENVALREGQASSSGLATRRPGVGSTAPGTELSPPVEPAEPTRVAAQTLVAPDQPLLPAGSSLVVAAEPIAVEVGEEAATEAPDGTVDSALADRISEWASAWSAQEVDAYLSFYAEDFLPGAEVERSDWATARRDRLTAPASIDVSIDGVSVESVSADRATTTFRQQYSSDVYSDFVTKTLEWVLEGGDWKISSEASTPIP